MNYILVLIVLLAGTAAAQVPLATHVEILKAEDSRRYDERLNELLSSPNEKVRERAALAAGRIGDDDAVPALVKLMKGDASVRVREMAAFALGEIESITAADAILVAIGETAKASLPRKPVHDNRGRLAEAAGKIAAANAKDPKAKDLGRAIIFTLEAELQKGTGQNRQTILLALTALLRARPEGTDVTAAKFLSHEDARIRTDALNTLTRVRAKNANLAIRKMLYSDADPNVRANAARALGAAEDKEALDLLLDAAVDGDDLRVRVSAIRSLAALKDAKAADKLLTRGEVLLAEIVKLKKPGFIPSQEAEFAEIAVTLGRLLANTDNARADKLFADFGKIDKGLTPEVYIARVRIGPKRGDGTSPELTNWKQYSTISQVVGEFAAIEPASEVGKAMKAEAPDKFRPLAKAFAAADPVADKETILAAPDALRAFARFKTGDLGEVLREALKNKDVFIRTAAAELIAELPRSPENIDALRAALRYGLETDIDSDDAVLGALDALSKLDPALVAFSEELSLSLHSPDHLVRKKARSLLTGDNNALPEQLRLMARDERLAAVGPYSGKGTKLGQILNKDVDYRRAAARKNGSVRAVFTTQKGVFTIELLPEDAPLTVDNFVKLARSGYFNGLEVHRVVPNFVMQDGDPLGNGSGGPGWSIRCEVNMVGYGRGAVGMALSGKDTGGSQWFVTHSPQPHLDGGYTVFGRVNEKDMSVVDKIVRGDKIISVRVIGR